MRMRGVVFVALVAVLTSSMGAPAPARQHHSRVAPADEYFGRLKLSILGVRNQLRDLALKVSFNPERGSDQIGAANVVEDAIHDWEHKYPQDSWLPKSVYMLSELYASIHSEDGQRKAASTLHWLIAKYPATAYAASARSKVSSLEVK